MTIIKRLALFLALAVTMLAALSAQCAEPIRVDPNTPEAGNRLRSNDLQFTDLRLSQKVTYEATNKPLKKILADLSDSTGVVLRAGYNLQDWQVRDRKMNVFAKDTPLVDLMNSIANVMKFNWSISKDDNPPTYRLYMNRRMLVALQADERNKEQLLKTCVAGKRAKFLDTMSEVAALSENDADKLKDENTYLYLAWKTGLARATDAIFKEVPGLRDIFISSQRNVVPPVSLLTPSTRQLLFDAIKGNWKYRQFQMETNEEFPEQEIDEILDRCVMGMEIVPRSGATSTKQLQDFGGLGIPTPDRFIMVGYYFDPDSISASNYSKIVSTGVDEGLTMEEVDRQLSPDYERAGIELSTADPKYSTLEPEIQHEDTSELMRKVVIDVPKVPEEIAASCLVNAAHYAAVQKGIAEASGYAVVSDAFASNTGYVSYDKADVPLKEALDKFATGYTYNWDIHGSVIEFRNRDWFKLRSSQLPEARVESWRKSLKGHGTLTLDEFAQIASLSYEQVRENILFDPVLQCCTSGEDWNIANNQALMQFYLSLSSDQKSILFTDDGLNINSVSPDQRRLVDDVLNYGRGFSWGLDQYARDHSNHLCLKAVGSVADGKTRYTFTLSRPDSTDMFAWHVTLPVYRGSK